MSDILVSLAAMIAGAHQDLLLAQPRYADPKCLGRYRSRVYSQNGEDGAIAEILGRIGGAEARRFVEIGAGDGLENNTRFLLEGGWSGTWVEGGTAEVESIRGAWAQELEEGRLKLVPQSIYVENATSLVTPVPILDVLSIDIDMHTSHVWRALGHLRPRIAVIEYNPAIPPNVDWEVPYVPSETWAFDNYYGASLKRLELIGRDLGYCLVGCELSGTNAFFVRRDLVGDDLFLAPYTAERHYEPHRLLPPVGQPPRRRPAKAA